MFTGRNVIILHRTLEMCLWYNIIIPKCHQCVESNYYYFIKYSTTEYLLILLELKFENTS